MKKYNKNEFVELTATSLCGNGNAIARDNDGFVFFLKGGVPGDKVKAKIIKVTKSYAVAIIEEFIEKSEMRTPDGCIYSGKCGGCVFQNITYEAECKYKETLINDDFERIANLPLRLSEFYPSISTVGYRNKAVYPVSENKDGKIISGYYAQNSHRICEHDFCLIGNPEFVKIRDFVVRFCEKNKISAYSEENGKGILRHIYIRSAEDNSFVLTLILSCDSFVSDEIEFKFVSELLLEFPNCVSVLINKNSDATNAILGKKWRKIYGDGYLHDTLLGKKFRIAPASFYQVNRKQAELLYTKASEFACVKEGETILDLYCGTGTIGICLAKPGCKLYGVEISPEAVIDAKHNAKINGVDGEFICLDAGEALNSERIKNLRPDVIILDPPRKGCGSEAVERIASFGAERIVYISCDPATLARDLKQFSELGYSAVKAVGVDMFARTGHCEVVVLLSRQINVHNMKLNSSMFEMIKSGDKTIELRLFDEKRQQFKTGDKIVFTNIDNEETLNTTIVKLHRFDSFKELYKSLPLLQCGYTTENVDNAKPSDMEQ